MSGPKITIYSVNPAVARNILEQIRCQQDVIRMDGLIRQLMAEMDGTDGETQAVQEALDLIVRRTGKGDAEQRALTQAVQAAKSAVLSAGNELRGLGHIDTKQPKFSEQGLKNWQERQRRMQALADTVKQEHAALHRVITEARSATEANRAAAQRSIGADLAADVDFTVRTPADPAAALKGQLLAEISTLEQDAQLSEELRKSARSALVTLESLADARALRNFASITAHPLAAKCEAYRTEVRREREGLCASIAHLRTLLGRDAAEVPQAATIDELRGQCDVMEQALLRQQEKAHITACIESAMADLGYARIAKRDVVKKSGRAFHTDLFTLGNGRGVSVLQSDNGQITMEIGGIDRARRDPEPHEAALLCEDMVHFCEDFAVLEQRLAAQGVRIARRVAHFEPGEEHAVIINLDDYAPVTDVPVQTIRDVPAEEIHVQRRRTL